jgi:predicted kinase
VVMDFPANTPKQRKWFLDLAKYAGAEAELIYLQTSDELCLSRLAVRRVEQPERAAFDNETVFFEVTRLFQEPKEDEGLQIEIREIVS